MEVVWLTLFAGPLVGFVLGMLAVFSLCRRFDFCRYLFFPSAQEQMPLLHRNVVRSGPSNTEGVPLLQQNAFSSSSQTLIPEPPGRALDLEAGLRSIPGQTSASPFKPAILYYASAARTENRSSVHPGPATQAPSPPPLPVTPVSATGAALHPQLRPSSPFASTTPTSSSSSMPTSSEQGSPSSPDGLLGHLYSLSTRATQDMLRQQLPNILQSNRLPWMKSVELLPGLNLGEHPPIISACRVAAPEAGDAQGGICLFLDVVWSPSLQAALRVETASTLPSGPASRAGPLPPQRSVMEVAIHGIEVRAALKLLFAPHPHGLKMQSLRPPGINLQTSCRSQQDASFGPHGGEAAKLIQQWLQKTISSRILGSMVIPLEDKEAAAATPWEQSVAAGVMAAAAAAAPAVLPSAAAAALRPIDELDVSRDTEPLLSPLATSSSVTEPAPVMTEEAALLQATELGRTRSHLNSFGAAETEVLLDLEAVRLLATMKPHVWSGIHLPGKACPFNVRGPNYLKDRRKVPAGMSAFTLSAFDIVALPNAVEHVARFLPSVRMSGAPFAIVINLIIPGTPLLGLVATFVTDRDCFALAASTPPEDPMDKQHGWTPFDFVLHRFMTGDVTTRNKMLKLIPHIDSGNWVVRQAVGTKPVIIGKALKTTYHATPQYIEIDIDVSANSTAAYITGMVRGATSGLVIDLGFVLEGQLPWELPECLIGAARVSYLDVRDAVKLDVTKEIPLMRPATKRV